MGRKKKNPLYPMRSNVDKQWKRAIKGRRNADEIALKCVDGAAQTIEIGYVMPGTCAVTGKQVLVKIVRVDKEIDAVYGVKIPALPMPWWKWNTLRRKGLVSDDDLEAVTSEYAET